MAGATPQTGYAPVNGLQMYYEIHGEGGVPLVVLHGAYMTVEGFAALLPALAATRQVVIPEMQGHGRTADVDRPLTYEQMADDVAVLLHHLAIEQADLWGFSMGATIALQVAIRHPDLVRRVAAASGHFRLDGLHPELLASIPDLTPAAFDGSPFKETYLQVAPRPEDFPTLVEKLKQLDMVPFAWPPEDIQGIAAPVLLIYGDSDAVRLEHAVELFKLLGGGVMGDLVGLPASQLVVLPSTLHFFPPGFGVLDRVDWLLSTIPPFLDAPMPETS